MTVQITIVEGPRLMFRTILVPLDGSPQSERVVPLAIAIAKAAGAKLAMALVIPSDDLDMRANADTYKHYLRDIVAKTAATGVATTEVLLDGPVATSLADAAKVLSADLVVMGTHGRGGLSRLWMGSVADKFIRQVTVPVLLLRATESPTPTSLRHILIAVDGSRASEAAIDVAVEVGKLFGAKYDLVHDIEPVPMVAVETLGVIPDLADAHFAVLLQERAEAYIGAIASRLRDAGLSVTTQIVIGEPAAQAILAASLHCDLIVLASHGRGAIARLLLGSVADKVVRGAETPVLLVHRED